MPPQCVVPPQTSQAAQVVPEVRRSASAKRLRATSQDADARQQAQQHAQHVAVAAVASPAWTARSLRVSRGKDPLPPSFREVLETSSLSPKLQWQHLHPGSRPTPRSSKLKL